MSCLAVAVVVGIAAVVLLEGLVKVDLLVTSGCWTFLFAGTNASR